VHRWRRSTPMLDAIVLTLTLVFFVASIGYAYACDRL
jgi:p-aminobenzoyl-glutamate transporter AbgT